MDGILGEGKDEEMGPDKVDGTEDWWSCEAGKRGGGQGGVEGGERWQVEGIWFLRDIMMRRDNIS